MCVVWPFYLALGTDTICFSSARLATRYIRPRTYLAYFSTQFRGSQTRMLPTSSTHPSLATPHRRTCFRDLNLSRNQTSPLLRSWTRASLPTHSTPSSMPPLSSNATIYVVSDYDWPRDSWTLRQCERRMRVRGSRRRGSRMHDSRVATWISYG